MHTFLPCTCLAQFAGQFFTVTLEGEEAAAPEDLEAFGAEADCLDFLAGWLLGCCWLEALDFLPPPPEPWAVLAAGALGRGCKAIMTSGRTVPISAIESAKDQECSDCRDSTPSQKTLSACITSVREGGLKYLSEGTARACVRNFSDIRRSGNKCTDDTKASPLHCSSINLRMIGSRGPEVGT